MDNIITTLRNNGYGNTPEEKGQEALDYHLEMRGEWLIRTSSLSEQEIAGIRILTEDSTGLSAVKKAVQQTIVARRREEVRDDRREQKRPSPGQDGQVLVTSFTPSQTVRRQSNRQKKVSTNRTCGTQRMSKLMIGLREARKKLQHATNSRSFLPQEW